MKKRFIFALFTSAIIHSSFANIPEAPREFFEQEAIAYASSEPIYTPPYKNAALAAGLSAIFPGLGHVYIGDMKTAGFLAGGTILATRVSSWPQSPHEISDFSAQTAYNTWMYGIYSAYRDARIMNGGTSYSYKMPTDSLADLAYAPINPRILKKPEVWGGVLGALTAAVGVGVLAHYTSSHGKAPSLSVTGRSLKPFVALPVGIGEEALFRGYLQPQLSEIFNPTASLALSSLAFGAIHLTNTRDMNKYEKRRYCTYSIPFITSLGAYFGWLAQKNGSLKECVAVHTLYDFILFGLDALGPEEASATKEHGFSMSIPF